MKWSEFKKAVDRQLEEGKHGDPEMWDIDVNLCLDPKIGIEVDSEYGLIIFDPFPPVAVQPCSSIWVEIPHAQASTRSRKP